MEGNSEYIWYILVILYTCTCNILPRRRRRSTFYYFTLEASTWTCTWLIEWLNGTMRVHGMCECQNVRRVHKIQWLINFFWHTARNFFAHSINAPTLPPILIAWEQAEDGMEGGNAQKKSCHKTALPMVHWSCLSDQNLNKLVLPSPATHPAARRTPIMVPRPLVKQKLPFIPYCLLLTCNQVSKRTAHG